MAAPFEQIEIGDAIPTLIVTPTATQLFFFSAATYNGHRIHYDRSWAVDVEGYPDVLVQGPLQAALLARAVTDWAAPSGRLVSFEVQNRASAHPGDELRFEGRVAGKRPGPSGTGGLIDLELQGEKASGELLMPGRATVELPARRDGS